MATGAAKYFQSNIVTAAHLIVLEQKLCRSGKLGEYCYNSRGMRIALFPKPTSIINVSITKSCGCKQYVTTTYRGF